MPTSNETRVRGGRLLEDHPERAAGKDGVGLARRLQPLQLVGEVERLQQLVPTPVGDTREVSALQLVRDRDHAWELSFARSDL